LYPLFATGVVNTSGKFAAGVVDTGGNLPPVSLIPVVHLEQFIQFRNMPTVIICIYFVVLITVFFLQLQEFHSIDSDFKVE
jgi:hypothetical protein